MAPTQSEQVTIEEFQQRLRELKPQWNRNMLFVFLPGFLLCGAGGPGGLLLPGGKANDNLWLIVPGIALCAIGLVRGAILLLRYRRCPQCNRFQNSEWRIPYRSCMGCGVRLSISVKDST
jgi:hypothetical protein